MRRALLTILLLGAAPLPAFALDASDTMQAWKQASGDERSALLKELGAGGTGVAQCLDDAAAAPGHASLSIGQVAKACASKGDQPV